MSVPAYVTAFKTFGYHAELADTTIDEEVPGRDGERLALIEALVTAGGTAHTLYIMYAEGTGSRNTASAIAAADQKDLVCTDAPKDPAGNAAAASDIIAYETAAGWEFNTIASLDTKTITLTNNIASAVPAGAKVMVFGVAADGANFQLAVGASAQSEFGKGSLCVVHPYSGEPFYVQDNNATAAGSIDNLVFAYLNK
jgi:hypothetical protein